MSRRRKGETAPRIYVADLAAYNAGRLHGRWIDADQDPDDIRAEIKEMLSESPVAGAEEYAIHDYEGFGNVKLAEYEDIDKIATIATAMKEHGEVFSGLLVYYDNNVDAAAEAMEERYQGAHRSLAEWAEQFAEDTGQGDCGPYSQYIDWEKVGRDAELGGDIFTIETDDGMVHVFYAQ